MRLGSSALARSSKRSSRVRPCLSVANRDWTRCIRPGSTGSGRSSPSARAPLLAMTLKATVPTRAGAASGKTTGVPPPGSTLNACGGTCAARPKAGARFSPVAGSVISSVTSPASGAVPALLTMTRRSALSPSRKNRGRYGRTMRSLTVFVSASSVPPARSRVTPWTKTRQLVTESGTTNSIVAVPSAPVEQVRLPEGRLGEIRPQLRARGLAGRGSRRRLPGLALGLLAPRHLVHAGLSGHGWHRCLRALGHDRAQHAADDPAEDPAAPSRPADAVAAEREERGRLEGRIAGELRPAPFFFEQSLGLAEPGLPLKRAHPVGIESQQARRVVRCEQVQAPVVHVGQELGRAFLGRRPLGRLDRDAPGLAAARGELVAEGREREPELLVVPRHEDRGLAAHELVIAQGRDPDAEAAPQVLADRDLDVGAVFAGFEPATLPEVAAAEGLEKKRLAGPAGGDEERGLAADRDARLLRPHDERQLEVRLGVAGDQEVEGLAANGPEIVFCFVDEAIGPGLGRRHGDDPGAEGVVFDLADRGRRVLSAFFPEAEDLLVRGEALPARPHPVAGRRRIGRAIGAWPGRHRLVGRKERRLRARAGGPCARTRGPAWARH